jgi:hypothetical protein
MSGKPFEHNEPINGSEQCVFHDAKAKKSGDRQRRMPEMTAGPNP